MNKLKDILDSKTVAVVGSSDNLKNHGTKIDSNDVVIRFNMAFPTKDNKEYIGEKTTIISTNHHVSNSIVNQNYVRYREKRFVSGKYCSKFNEYVIKKQPILLTRGKFESNQFNLICLEENPKQYCNKVLEKLSIKYSSLKGWNIKKKPRMGFYIVCVLIALGIKPTLYYFDINHPSYSKFYGNKKFIEKKASSAKPKTHDIQTECRILKKLIQLKIIKHVA